MLRKSISLLVTVAVLAVSLPILAATDLDFAFQGGKVISPLTSLANGVSSGNSVAVQPDGKILAAGFGRGPNITGMAIRRFNADGTIDSTFGNLGSILEISSGPTFFNSYGYEMELQSDGKIVMVGYIDSNNLGTANLAEATRFNANGTIDTAFGANGLFSNSFGGSASFADVALQTDGKMVAVGRVAGNFLVARLTATGALDTTFGTGGFITTDFDGGNDFANSVIIKSNGQIIVGGRSDVTGSRCVLAAYTTSGVLDATFGTGGKVVTDVTPNNRDDLSKILLQSDGKIVGLGTALTPTGFPQNQLLVRYNANGTLDTTFGTNGVTTANYGNTQQEIYGGVLLADGKIFAVGYAGVGFQVRVTISRFNSDGTLDKTYGCNGFNYTTFNASNNSFSYGYDAAQQADGKVVVVGTGRSNAFPFDSLTVSRYTNKSSRCASTDFDRDGISDFSVFRPGTRNWHGLSSENGTDSTFNFGLATDKLTPADFDGDGRTDYAVWREAPATQAAFYVFQSTNNTVRTELFGQTGDKPNVVGDFDGDGKADPAVYRNAAFGNQSYFFYRGSLNNPNGNITYQPWGTNGDEGIRGDFDGDGKQDAAVYRPSDSTWYVLKSSNNSLQTNYWGLNSDKRIEGDFDGDGKTDFAVFRPGDATWYIQKSSDSQMIATQFGLATDQLAPADYDGDGKTDIAVFRNGTWYVQNSGNSSLRIGYFGTSGDSAIPSAFVP